MTCKQCGKSFPRRTGSYCGGGVPTVVLRDDYGNTYRLNANTTLKELVRMGVTAVAIRSPADPLPEGWWRVEGDNRATAAVKREMKRKQD
jgi:hypothetical protein